MKWRSLIMPSKNKREYKQSKKYEDKQYNKEKKRKQRKGQNPRFKKRTIQEQETNRYLTRNKK